MLQSLDIQLQPVDEHSCILRLNGDLDMFTCAELKATFQRWGPADHYSLVVDLERVRYIDSMGLGTLLAAVNQARHHHGRLAFVCTQPNLLKLFHLTGVHRVLNLHATEAEALGTLHHTRPSMLLA